MALIPRGQVSYELFRPRDFCLLQPCFARRSRLLEELLFLLQLLRDG
jgi:hypothetical protein